MKRLIAAAVSLLLLGILFWKADRAALAAALNQTDLRWLVPALAMFIPQTLAIAWRWTIMVAPFTRLGIPESMRMVLAGGSMNIILPSKLGDLTKGWFLARQGALELPRALGIVVFEKMLDVAALALLMLGGVAWAIYGYGGKPSIPMTSLVVALGAGIAAVGLVALIYWFPLKTAAVNLDKPAKSASGVTSPPLTKLKNAVRSGHETVALLKSRQGRHKTVMAITLLIWLLHLTQIWMFFRSLGMLPPAGEFLSMTPLAIFIGLLPVSVAGFGTRDAAFVALFPTTAPELMIALALYVNLRYIIPALAGLPFLPKYLPMARKLSKRMS